MVRLGWRLNEIKPPAFQMPVLRALLCISMILVSTASIAVPAQIRQSVIATAMRCSVIADSHQWLDCFYGSAQQMRLSLKLVPAPDTQLLLTQNPPSGGMVYDANLRVSVLSAAVNCGSLDDDQKWLNCYYGSADKMRVTLGLKPISPSGVASALPAQPSLVAGGLAMSNDMSNRTVKPAKSPPRLPLRSQVSSYSFDQLGMFTIALTNGQTWHQISGDTNYAGRLSANDTITITRGAIGSYNMRIGKHPEYFKVRPAQ